MSLELPRFGLSEIIAAAQCVICVAVGEAVLDRHSLPAGAGMLAGSLAAAWLYLGTLVPARAVCKATWLPDGNWLLEFRDGQVRTAQLGTGTRILGTTLVLQWRMAERSLARWLTPWDVDDGQLSAVSARLGCVAGLRAS